ncbi:magnesium transporter, partial [Enterobacter roggenkampii]
RARASGDALREKQRRRDHGVRRYHGASGRDARHRAALSASPGQNAG